jgi:fermentation-respiration switch protein FrsA (DUF1100 family)
MRRLGLLPLFAIVVSFSLSAGGDLRADEPRSTPPKVPAAAKAPTLDEPILFQPAKHPRGRWDDRPESCRDIWFESADKTRLHGWYSAAEDPVETVLYCHGNAGNVSLYGRWMEYMRKERRLSILVFDYRGYGRSEGMPTIEGAVADALAARAELARLSGVKSDRIILWGRSLGGAIAVEAAAAEPPRGLVLESTFSSFRDVADVHRPSLSWLVPEDRLNSVLTIGKVRCPLLQAHGTVDRVVPYDLGKKLHEAASEPKTLLTFQGYGHHDIPAVFEQRLDLFLKSLPARDRPAQMK